MRSLLGRSMAGGAGMALALLAAFSVAKATNGRISFSGAVVEPTCAIADGHLANIVRAPGSDAPHRLVCGQTATDPGRPYSRVVMDLDAARAADDRLLGYMLRRATPAEAGGAPLKLVVRTYD